MGKIVNLANKAKYQRELKDVAAFLDDINDYLRHKMFVLATLDTWKEWSDNQPVGSTAQFTEEMLQNTGDKNIDALHTLRTKMTEISAQCRKG